MLSGGVLEETLPIFLSVLLAAIVLALALWILIWVPYDMALRRQRSGGFWVLVSLLLTPVVAILLLALLGNADRDP